MQNKTKTFIKRRINLNTTIYLVRHGKTDKTKLVQNDVELFGNKEVDLDESFIPQIEALSDRLKLYEIENVYSSNFIRAKKTANILSKGKNVKVDNRLGERIGGTPNLDITPIQYYKMQFDDPNYKFPDGESINDIIARMRDAFNDILNENKGGEALVVSHGAAITFFLKKWCMVDLIDAENKIRRFSFRGKVFHEGVVNFIMCFKLTFNDDNELEDIEVV